MLNTFKKSQDPDKNKPWLRFLVLAIFGTLILAVCSILPGCGSDGTPGGSVKGKNDSAAKGSKVQKPQAATPLLTDTQGKDGRLLKKSPEVQRVEIFPGITQDELDAKKAAQRAKFNPAQMEIFPGAKITNEQMEARKAAQRAKFDVKKMEVFPGSGITQEQMEARKAAQRAKFDVKGMEVFPGAGITNEQIEKRKALAKANQDPNYMPKSMMEKSARGPQ